MQFFDVPRTRAWIMVRRIAHTAHHRGQQMAMLRMLNHDLFSNYGPTADTEDKVAYAYPDIETLLRSSIVKGNIITVPIHKIDPGDSDKPEQDLVAVEEPLQIRLGDRDFAITMRTPGQDRELAAGFLFTEGVIQSPNRFAPSQTRHDRGVSNRHVTRRRRRSKFRRAKFLRDVELRRLRQSLHRRAERRLSTAAPRSPN